MRANYPTTENFNPKASRSSSNENKLNSEYGAPIVAMGDPGLSMINPTSSAIYSDHYNQYQRSAAAQNNKVVYAQNNQ